MTAHALYACEVFLIYFGCMCQCECKMFDFFFLSVQAVPRACFQSLF